MRKIIVFIMAGVLLATACNVQKVKANEQDGDTSAADAQNAQETQLGFKLKIGEKIGPMFSEKIDTAKQSVYTDLNCDFAGEVIKGDDGSCYYFRKKTNRKLIFYKNNGIKVCETKIDKAIEEKYYISTFVKYGSRFFLALANRAWHSDDYEDGILTTIDIETGEWGEMIEAPDDYYSMMVYEDCFYCKMVNGKIRRYDLTGQKTELKEAASKKYHQHIQCIVDGKIYYVVDNFTSKQKVKVVRSNLDGSDIETLFTYSGKIIRGGYGYSEGCLQIDGNYMYLTGRFGKVRCLVRIPLYGGKVKKVHATAGQYELSEDSIFFGKGDYVYKLNKNLKGKARAVIKYAPAYSFHYADGHLMVQGYNKKEHKIIDEPTPYDPDGWDIDIAVKEYYIDDYYWVNEKGKIEDVIKGSGVK